MGVVSNMRITRTKRHYPARLLNCRELMLRRYGASARSARARRTYDRIMVGSP